MKRLISLLAAVTAVVMFALPGFAQSTSYTWALNCSKVSPVVGTGVNWYWLHNGVQISYTDPPNGFASCDTPPLSGSGMIPPSINEMQVNGIGVTLSMSEPPAGCEAFATLTKSFDPSNPSISINETVSAPGTVKNFGVTEHCANASFKFSLSS